MNERMKRIIFVVNPISGTQSKELILNLLDEKIDKARYTWEVVYTERAGHAVEIAAKAAEEKADVVVAIGGDGTINEIARSLVHTDTALGIIPCGSGNGLARHLHIPMEPKKALEVLNEGCLDTIDYGKINGTDFFCTCGVGFDAFVSLKFAHAGKRGLLTYLEKTLQESLKYQPETYELETENGVSKYKAFLIACGNASQYGNNAYIAPQATLTDGLLDVTILEPFTVLDVPSLAFQLFNKTIDQNSRIKTFRCKKLCIRRAVPGVVHFDGDPMETEADVNIELIKSGLRVVVPKTEEKDAANVLQRAQEYVNGIKLINEAIVDNITDKNKKILKMKEEPIMELTYHRKGDYLFPNLTVEEEEVTIGKYGMLRRTFLKEHKNSLYQSLFLTGKLNSHLEQIEKAAQERMDSQMEKLLEKNPAPDKEADPMAWTAHMNALMATAEESILTELVYS